MTKKIPEIKNDDKSYTASNAPSGAKQHGQEIGDLGDLTCTVLVADISIITYVCRKYWGWINLSGLYDSVTVDIACLFL